MGRMGQGTGKGRSRREQGGKQGEEVKKAMLVGDMQEYWGLYVREGSDKVRDL